ncbi:MAG: ParB N-terminal domain-containing protein [Phascolarctobacterium sp.]|nr:ParB N-terminal domain-containing protein [Candidatus Phascolarctobacterium caballi]
MAKENKKFNLTELLNQRSKEVATEEVQEQEEAVVTDGEQTTADIYDLIPSKENFYNTEDVQDLKESIELVGVLQPLLVSEPGEDGKRHIFAGHRRRRAIMQLVEEGKERFRYVPIMVKPKKDKILDKLALIMANRFREKTDWEKMQEAIETERLVLELKEQMDIPGRTRDLLAEIINTSSAQLGRYKAIYNNLIPELMEEFKANNIGVSIIYEASGLEEEYQKRAAEIFRENETLTLPDIKQLKKQWEAAQPIPGQMNFEQMEQGGETDAAEENEERRENEAQGQQEEYVDPQPESITSLCYSCTHYEECHDKKATVTSCNAYENRREAQKTDEERYSEEQEAIDRETKKKLREMQQEERMQHLPSDEAPKQRDIRLAGKKYEEVTSGQLTFLLLKKDGFKLGEEIELPEYKEGQPTGRKADIEIIYILEDWTGLDDDYCIIGFNVTAFDA